jgi:hypothetical protein
MPIISNTAGKVNYQLAGHPSEPSHHVSSATNRQKKLLRFFNISFSEKITVGAAGWEIAGKMSEEANRELWHRYLFLTKDFDSDTDSLKPFDEAELKTVEIPEDWNSSEEFRHFRDELVEKILHDESPFDRPQPVVLFAKRSFIFTGKFSFGTRKACQEAVISRGGSASDSKSVSHQIDYLVIGAEGSTAWRRGTYGNKIEDAILARRDFGSPAIISEEHWAAALNQNPAKSSV